MNNGRTQVMIIKSRWVTYPKFIYYNNNLEDFSSYKYLPNWYYSVERRINKGWKAYFDIENNCMKIK